MLKPRQTATKQTRATIYVVTEGSNTEPLYLKDVWNLTQSSKKNYVLRIAPNKSGSGRRNPSALVEKANNYMNEPKNQLSERDQVWIVCDVDNWTKQDQENLSKWVKEDSIIKRGVAISNPKFEVWLIMHLDVKTPPKDSHMCDTVLKKLTKNKYSKSDISCLKLTLDKLDEALKRAKKFKGSYKYSSDEIYPPDGCTNVDELINVILRLSPSC